MMNRRQAKILAGALRLFLIASFCFQFGTLLVYASESESEKNKSTFSNYEQEAGKHVNLACENGSSFKTINEKTLDIKSGTFLIESLGDLELQLPMSVMQMPSKSTVLIRVSNGSERIYCLNESLTVICEKREISLHCGDEVLLTDHAPKQGEISGEYQVGVRQLRAFDISELRKVATMEFSIFQALLREPLLNQVSHSKNSHDRTLKNRLLKAAAAFQMFPRRGQYMLGY